MTAPLSSFASASASKPVVPNSTELWEMVGQDGGLPSFDAVNPNSDVTGLHCPTLPPTSVSESVKGGEGDPPGDDHPDYHTSKGSDKPDRGRKDKGGKKPTQGCRRPPGGGPGDGDDDDGDDGDGESDDSDCKFVRRMRAFFGTPKDPSGDKNEVKEADAIKVPAFPHAESYRNWRIRTREAVMSAPTDPDKAFDWISETWKEGQTMEQLRDVGKFTTLDAKLLSALTNILTGFRSKGRHLQRD